MAHNKHMHTSYLRGSHAAHPSCLVCTTHHTPTDFSYGGHNDDKSVPKDVVRGAYFYTSTQNGAWSLQNTGTSHRWSGTKVSGLQVQ
jgi:hypothetical protein